MQWRRKKMGRLVSLSKVDFRFSRAMLLWVVNMVINRIHVRNVVVQKQQSQAQKELHLQERASQK